MIVWVNDKRDGMESTGRIAATDRQKLRELLLVTYFMSGTKGEASGWPMVRERQFWESDTQDLSL